MIAFAMTRSLSRRRPATAVTDRLDWPRRRVGVSYLTTLRGVREASQHARREEPFPPGIRERLAGFAELFAPGLREVRRRRASALEQLAPFHVHAVPGLDRPVDRAPRPLHLDTDLRGEALGRLGQARLGLAETHPQARRHDEGLGRLAEIGGEGEEPERRDQPLRGVPLVPAHAVAEVGRELVMKVVVPLAVGDEGEEAVVPRGILLRVGPRAIEVRDG